LLYLAVILGGRRNQIAC